jgi:uncharacterized membrane protein
MYIYLQLCLGLLATVVGLGVSFHIYRKKRQKSKLFCPLRTQCDEVVNSPHANTIGISNEVLGILYYVVVGAALSILLICPSFYTPTLFALLKTIVTLGFLFSLYLIFLQAFVLRAWCTWCLLSAFANVVLVVSLVVL